MKRAVKRSPMPGGQVRFTVVLTGDTVESDMEKRQQQQVMLQTLAEQTELWNCGGTFFQTLKMRFSGDAWVVELEAVSGGMPDAP